MACFTGQLRLVRRCNKRIQGYDHFGSGCVLFDPEEVARYNAMLAAQGEVMCVIGTRPSGCMHGTLLHRSIWHHICCLTRTSSLQW